MKNLFRSALALIIIVASILGVTSCSPAPQLNIDKAEDSLEDEGYVVQVADSIDDGYGLIGSLDFDSLGSEVAIAMDEMLFAMSEDFKDMIIIIVFDNSIVAKLFYENIEASQVAEIEELEREIEMKKLLLRKYKKQLTSSEINELEDSIKDLEKQIQDTKETVLFGCSGKTVWMGTEDAVKDSRK